MIFDDLWVLILLPLLILAVYIFRKREASAGILFSSIELAGGESKKPKAVLASNIWFLRTAALSLFIVALARPQVPLKEARVETEGIDIVLAIDSSGSMLAEDFTSGGKRLNRLDVVKGVVEEFVLARRSDRIGLVTFAARAYTVCPLTLDYDWLIENLNRVEIGNIEDGTAIGSAISSSLNRLKESGAESKVVILLTDGVNNSGKISPAKAAEAAKAMGIKIYTIGAGTKGLVPYPVTSMWGRRMYQQVRVDIDEETLKRIADTTGGIYFRATDTESLKSVYDEINKLEKVKIEEEGFSEHMEVFGLFLIPGLLILLTESILSNTILRKIP